MMFKKRNKINFLSKIFRSKEIILLKRLKALFFDIINFYNVDCCDLNIVYIVKNIPSFTKSTSKLTTFTMTYK